MYGKKFTVSPINVKTILHPTRNNDRLNRAYDFIHCSGDHHAGDRGPIYFQVIECFVSKAVWEGYHVPISKFGIKVFMVEGEAHLELFALFKGKKRETLLLTPAALLRVTHDGFHVASVVESRVEMKGNVVIVITKVNWEYFTVGFDPAGDAQLPTGLKAQITYGEHHLSLVVGVDCSRVWDSVSATFYNKIQKVDTKTFIQ